MNESPIPDITIDSSMSENKKYKKLQLLLGLPQYIVDGIICRLFRLAAQQCPDGDFSGWKPEEIGLICEWGEKSKDFWKGLLEAGFMESSGKSGKIVNWYDRQRLLVRRLRERGDRRPLSSTNRALRSISIPTPEARVAEADSKFPNSKSTEVPSFDWGLGAFLTEVSGLNFPPPLLKMRQDIEFLGRAYGHEYMLKAAKKYCEYIKKIDKNNSPSWRSKKQENGEWLEGFIPFVQDLWTREFTPKPEKNFRYFIIQVLKRRYPEADIHIPENIFPKYHLSEADIADITAEARELQANETQEK